MSVFDDLIAMANPTIIIRDLHRQAGASWEVRQYLEVDEVPMDWAGCAASSSIKARDGTLILSFATSLATGWVTLSAAPTYTALAPGAYVYDVDIVNASARRLALMSGNFHIAPQVTT